MAGLFFGTLFALPTGWFLKAAFTWRREAKKAIGPTEVHVVSTSAQPASAPLESRLERTLELVNRRLEAMEDRLEFTERLLDTRAAARQESLEAHRKIGPQAQTDPGSARR